MRKKWFKSNWKRLLVIVVCLALIIVHSIWSQLKFDNINIWLGAIIIILFLVPNLSFLFPYLKRVKRFKAGDLEYYALKNTLLSVPRRANTSMHLFSPLSRTSHESTYKMVYSKWQSTDFS